MWKPIQNRYKLAKLLSVSVSDWSSICIQLLLFHNNQKNVYPHSFPVTLKFLELSCAKASKRHQKSRWEFYLENTNSISVDDQWIKTAKKQFKRFRYELKLEKRRKKENLSHHSLEKTKNNFEELMRHIKTFDEAIQKRLRMINSHWLNLTLF